MHKSSIIGTVYNESPFLGAIVDGICDFLQTGEVIRAWTECFVVVSDEFRRHMKEWWTVRSIQDIEHRTWLFKKMHTLRSGEIRHLKGWSKMARIWPATRNDDACWWSRQPHVGVWKALHKLFKSFYGISFDLGRQPMKQIVSMRNARNAEPEWEFGKSRNEIKALISNSKKLVPIITVVKLKQTWKACCFQQNMWGSR